MDSPRGRIYQIVQVDEGRLALSDSFVTHIDRCLGCLNCQTACPSGVAYGSLLEQARAQIAENYQRPWLATWLRKHFYADILPSFRRLEYHARFLRFCQRSGLQSLARASGILKLLGLRPWARVSGERTAAWQGGPADRMRGQCSLCGTQSRDHSRADEERNRGARP
jgi:glycolate oxidase iron-sulfur subunit